MAAAVIDPAEFDAPLLRAANNPKFYSRFKWIGIACFAWAIYCLYDGFIGYPQQKVRGEKYQELALAEWQKIGESNGWSSDKVEERTIAAWRELADQRGLPKSETKGKTLEELEAIASQNNWSPTKARAATIAGWQEVAKDNEWAASRIKNVIPDAWEGVAKENGWPTKNPGKPKTDSDIAQNFVQAAVAAVVGVCMLMNVVLASRRWIEAGPEGVTTSWGEKVPFASVVAIDKKRWKDKGIAYVDYEAGGKRRRFVVDDYKYDRYKCDEVLRRIEQAAGVDKIQNGVPELPIAEVIAANTANTPKA
jgi:hypothetical protein